MGKEPPLAQHPPSPHPAASGCCFHIHGLSPEGPQLCSSQQDCRDILVSPYATWCSRGQEQLSMGRTSPELATSAAAWTERSDRKRRAGGDICVEISQANIWWFVEN